MSPRPHVEGDPDGIPSRYVARIYQAVEERDAALMVHIIGIREAVDLLAPLPEQVAGLQARLDELDGRTDTIEARDRREAEREAMRRELAAEGWGPRPTNPGVLVDSHGHPMTAAPPAVPPSALVVEREPRTPIADGVGALLTSTAKSLPMIIAIVSIVAGLATGGTVVGLEGARMVLEQGAELAPAPAPPMLPDVEVDTASPAEARDDTGGDGDGATQGDTSPRVEAR